MLTVSEQMARESQARGIAYKDCGHGHYQVLGKLLVNYYPTSKKRSAYIAGTTKALTNISVPDAFALSQSVPAGLEPTKRKQSYRKIKERMLKKSNVCHWCQCKLNSTTATVDHFVPLSKGGLDHSNNRVLACEPCNQKRGNWMPELKGAI